MHIVETVTEKADIARLVESYRRAEQSKLSRAFYTLGNAIQMDWHQQCGYRDISKAAVTGTSFGDEGEEFTELTLFVRQPVTGGAENPTIIIRWMGY